MSAIPYDTHEDDWDSPEDVDGESAPLPGRPRRRLLNRRSATLLALITGAAGFYAGIRIEKGHVSGTTSSTPGFSLPAGLSGGASTTRRGATGSGSGSGSASASRGGVPAGLPSIAGGNSSFGTVSSIDGSTLYISDASGNTVRVKLSGATKLTKSLSVSRKAVRPGDSVQIQGLKKKNGTIVATSVSDSGASASSAGSGAAAGTSSAGSSAVSSLFGAGGGG